MTIVTQTTKFSSLWPKILPIARKRGNSFGNWRKNKLMIDIFYLYPFNITKWPN